MLARGIATTPSVSPTIRSPGFDRDVADEQRMVDPAARLEVLRRSRGCRAAREHREADAFEDRAVADAAVDHETAEFDGRAPPST